MDLRTPAKTICLAAAIAVTLAVPALGAPAGDEYLPKVPKASGSAATSDQGSGGSATTSDDGSTDTQTQGAAPFGGGGSGGGDGNQPNTNANPVPAPISSAPASSSDDSSDSTLLSPVVILLVAGVIIAAVGMTLRRRNADGEGGQEEAPSGRAEPGKAPPTPDGEIVTGDRTR
jgi:hypothetical protein